MDLPIGISDFRELREKRLVYVDKTRLVIEMLDQGMRTKHVSVPVADDALLSRLASLLRPEVA
jgi:hypothetical protein